MTTDTTPRLTDLTDAQLAKMLRAVGDEIARRKPPTVPASEPMRVTASFRCYNPRRYSRPWIARVTAWAIANRPEIDWGRYLGDDNNGGEVEIMATPGDIIRWGQKDLRRSDKSESYWGIVEADGTIRQIEEPEARRLYATSR